MNDSYTPTPVERVLIAYEVMTNNAKRGDASEGQWSVRDEDLEELRNAIQSLPGDAEISSA